MKKLILAFLATIFALSAISQELTVASYNIRTDTKKDHAQGDGWSARCPQVCRVVIMHDFDIFGAQEVRHNQLLDLCSSLPEYDYVGVARDDGATKGEYSPVFYKRERFELLESGTFWLSESIDCPSKGWDARYPRICSWARLKDKESKRTLSFFNLHMDHRGIVARRESSKLVLKQIAKIAKPNEPVILTGDFNVNQHSDIYAIIAQSGILFDAYESAKLRLDINGTFNNFNPQAWTESRIDHIFLSPEWSVERYNIPTDVYWSKIEGDALSSENFPKEQKFNLYQTRMPSDHFPVVVTLNYGSKRKPRSR